MLKTIIAFVLVLCTSLNASAKHVLDEYAELNKFLGLLKGGINSPYLDYDFSVKSKTNDINISDVKVWVEKEGKILAHAEIAQDGVIVLPIFTVDEAEDSYIVASHTKDDLNLLLDLVYKPIKSNQVSYLEVFTMLNDINYFIDEMAGGFSIFVPSLDELEFQFENQATITVIDQEGKTHAFTTDDTFKAQVPFEDDWYHTNTKLAFTSLPTSYEAID